MTPGKRNVRYREVFFAFHGPPPYACVFCGAEVGWDVSVHHVDRDHGNNEADNLAPAHRGCHSIHHQLGRKWTEGQRAKATANMLGKTRTATQREHYRIASLLRWQDSSYREKIVASSTGKKHSPEALAKIGAASKARVTTPEARANMSRAQKERNQRLRDVAANGQMFPPGC